MKGHAYTVTVQLVIDVPDEILYPPNYIADAVNELLREHRQSFTPISCLLDYQIIEDMNDLGLKVLSQGYQEGDAFRV